MRKEPAELSTELLRKVVHVGSGLVALALRWLTWPQALALALGAFAFNLLLLPRIGGRRLQRPGEIARGWAFGILAYPASVAALVLLFRQRLDLVAIGWVLMAFGDGAASVVGTIAGRRALSWNTRKSWEGLLAHVVFGGVAATLIGGFVAGGAHAGRAWPGWWALALACAIACVLTAFAETLESGVDDNLTVPFLGAAAAGLLIALVTSSAWSFPPARAELATRAAWALLACAALSAAALWRGSLTRAGALAALVDGVLIAAFGGWRAFAALCLFFGLGVGATRVGRAVKESRGIAQERGGRRGVANVIANGGVAAAMAVMAWSSHSPIERAAWLVGAVTALATAAFDTVSSEVGKAYGRRTFLITTLRPVPPGTEGAVSLEGTLAGASAALVVGLSLAGASVFAGGRAGFEDPVGLGGGIGLGCVVAGAFVGTTFESVVGAACERRGLQVDTHVLNFANTAVGGLSGAGLMFAWIARGAAA